MYLLTDKRAMIIVNKMLKIKIANKINERMEMYLKSINWGMY
jgi:hypothetical protein